MRCGRENRERAVVADVVVERVAHRGRVGVNREGDALQRVVPDPVDVVGPEAERRLRPAPGDLPSDRVPVHGLDHVLDQHAAANEGSSARAAVVVEERVLAGRPSEQRDLQRVALPEDAVAAALEVEPDRVTPEPG